MKNGKKTDDNLRIWKKNCTFAHFYTMYNIKMDKYAKNFAQHR